MIKKRGDEWRDAVPILKRQDLVGLTIFLLSIASICMLAYGYWIELISPWLSVPLIAILCSFLHELEHDLIHRMYFKNNALVHNIMLLGVWVFRPTTINPWIRRHLHLLHHKVSGTKSDIEEVGIGNGQAFGFLRWWIMLDTFSGNIARALLKPGNHKTQHVLKIIAVNFPFPVVCAICWYSFLLFHIVEGATNFIGISLMWSDQTLHLSNILDKVIVLVIAPSLLRSFCLNFISSNMHYHGGVDSLMRQTQVLNAWYFWPLQLFCFNFGSTHSIHHFVVGEPFYVRQLTVSAAHEVMHAKGIRFNDLGTFRRRNHF